LVSGATAAIFAVPILADLREEGDETFLLRLTDPQGAALGDGEGRITIADDDRLFVRIAGTSVLEGNDGTTDAAFAVTLSAPHGGPVTVAFATTDGTATAGEDYQATSGTVTFDPGTTEQTVTVAVLGDTVDEVTETFFVELHDPTGVAVAVGSAEGVIRDDDGVTADAGGPYTATEGQESLLDASVSASPNGTLTAYAWDLDADGAFDDAFGVVVSASFPDNGTFTVAVRVTDDTGESDTASATVTVTNASPQVHVPAEQTLVEGDLLTLDAVTFTDPGTDDTHTATVDWGDGTVEAAPAASGVVSASHAYADDGSYTVTVCVTDDDGGEGCGSFAAPVANALPVLAAGAAFDLRTWHAELHPGSSGSVNNWVVNSLGTQVRVNRDFGPTVFLSEILAKGIQVDATIGPGRNADDDFVGLALGFRPGDFENPDAEWLLLDWKQRTQGAAVIGMALSRVRGTSSAGGFFPHNGITVQEIARARTLGSKGYSNRKNYRFVMEVSDTLVRVWVNGSLEFDVEGDFRSIGGFFGFYNYSQDNVRYWLSSQDRVFLEGTTGEVALPFTDPGAADTHTVSVAWSDGVASVGSVEPTDGGGVARVSRLFADDAQLEALFCVEDDDGGEGCETLPVEVLNVPPVVAPGRDRPAFPGELLEIAEAFTDPGPLDTHTATVDWGDGTVTAGEVLGREIHAAHAYTTEGDRAVEICVTDDDGAGRCGGFTALVRAPVLDLGISAAAQPTILRPGADVDLTVAVANLGTREPRGVTVTAQLPPLLALVAATPAGSYDPVAHTLTWTLGEILFQEGRQLGVTLRSADALPFDTEAVVALTVSDDGAFGADDDPTNNQTVVAMRLWDAVTPAIISDLAQVTVAEGAILELTAAFTDTDPLEEHTATVDWGDGTAGVPTLEESDGNGTLAALHVYGDDGVFTARVCVTDPAGHEGCSLVGVVVENAQPEVNGPVDLRRWDFERLRPTEPTSWFVKPDGTQVLQTRNEEPNFFYGDFAIQDLHLGGTIRVEDTTDNDFVGFALGFEPGDLRDPNADFLLLTWKKADQGTSGSGACPGQFAPVGLALSRVRGRANDLEYWGLDNLECNGFEEGIELLARGLTRGSAAWEHRTTYTFAFELTPTGLRIFVDGTLEFDVEGTFAEGRLAFFSHSQENTLYGASAGPPDVIAVEGSEARMISLFHDPGALDTHTFSIAWGDGSTTPGASDGPGRFAGTHIYGDDGLYTVEGCVTDDDGSTGCGTLPATILNAPPVVDAGAPFAVPQGALFTYDSAIFTDPGFLDTHTAVVDWGDGTVEASTVTEANGAGTVSADHSYAAAGIFSVTVCVTDDDGATACAGTEVAVNDLPDAPVRIGDATAVEGEGALRFMVTLGEISSRPVTVTYVTEAGTATAGVDFETTTGTLTLAPGQGEATITVVILDDDLDESEDETLTLRLTAVEGGILEDAEATGTLLDDDTARLSLEGVTVDEGDTGTTEALFRLRSSNPADRAITATYTTVESSAADAATEGTDYLPATGTVTLEPGEITLTIPVDVVGDLLLEEDEETFLLRLTGASAEIATAEATGTILDDEVCPGPELVANPGAEMTFSQGADGWLAIEGGWTRRTAVPDPAEGTAYFATTEAAGGIDTGFAELLQIIDLGPYADRIDTGDQPFAFHGQLRTAAEDPSDVARILVEYRAADGTLLDAFDSGEIAAPTGWQRVEDTRPAPVGTRQVHLRLLATRFTEPGIDGYFDALSLTSRRTAVLTTADVEVREGDGEPVEALFLLTLNCPVEGETQVTYATADGLPPGAAVAGEDYLATTGTVTIPEGETTAAVPVTVLGDAVHEVHEHFFLDLATASENLVLLPKAAIATIRNDDFCARSPGFWKTHREVWPVESLVIGAVEVNAEEMMALLEYKGPDAANHLARQLVATKLNLLVGSDPWSLPTVEEADAFVTEYPPGSNPRGAARTEGNGIKDVLDGYNNSGCTEVPVVP
jgi:hypothetical protein